MIQLLVAGGAVRQPLITNSKPVLDCPSSYQCLLASSAPEARCMPLLPQSADIEANPQPLPTASARAAAAVSAVNHLLQGLINKFQWALPERLPACAAAAAAVAVTLVLWRCSGLLVVLLLLLLLLLLVLLVLLLVLLLLVLVLLLVLLLVRLRLT